jgi:hypothetical protein
MMDDTIFIEEFIEYRRVEAEKGAAILRQLMFGQTNPEFFAGAMHMLKAIINLPLEVSKTDEAQKRAEECKVDMLAAFESKMMRKVLE